MPHYKDKGEDVLNDLAEYAQSLMKSRLRIDENLALDISLELSKKMRQEWGGQYIYFKKLNRTLVRDKMITNSFYTPGCDRQELAKEYNITIQRLYQIANKYKPHI